MPALMALRAANEVFRKRLNHRLTKQASLVAANFLKKPTLGVRDEDSDLSIDILNQKLKVELVVICCGDPSCPIIQ